MTFYDFITFVIDIVGGGFCFIIRFIASWSTEKNLIFMTLNGPRNYKSYWTAVLQFIFEWFHKLYISLLNTSQKSVNFKPTMFTSLKL